jgi:uncharacterized membrane protein YdjX (TVP38/TMEM64 family)
MSHGEPLMRPLNAACREHIRRSAALLLMFAVLLLVVISSTAYGYVRALIDRAGAIVAQQHAWGLVLFLLLSALSAMLAFFSTAVVVPVAITAWGRAVTVLLLWTGWWIGGAASYLIGRFVGRPAVRWLVAEERLRKFEKYAHRTLSFPRLLLLQVAVPSEIPGYVLGSLKFSPAQYLFAVAVVELPFALGTVYLGDRFLARDYVLLAGVALAGLAATFIAGWFVHHRRPADDAASIDDAQVGNGAPAMPARRSPSWNA